MGRFEELCNILIGETEEDEEVQELMSAVYIDKDGKEYTIDQLDTDDEEVEEDEESVSEAIKKVRVVRGGKRMRKFKSTKDGFKIKMVDGKPKEIKMTPKEKMKRKKAAKKAVRKGKSKRKIASRKRKKSMKKR